LRDAPADPGDACQWSRGGHVGPAEVPALRIPDGSRRAHLPPDELTRALAAPDQGQSESGQSESRWPVVDPIGEDTAHSVLRDGEVEVLGRMPWSSNATFLVCLSTGSDQLLAIYKPQRGERPLWDFPRGT